MNNIPINKRILTNISSSLFYLTCCYDVKYFLFPITITCGLSICTNTNWFLTMDKLKSDISSNGKLHFYMFIEGDITYEFKCCLPINESYYYIYVGKRINKTKMQLIQDYTIRLKNILNCSVNKKHNIIILKH